MKQEALKGSMQFKLKSNQLTSFAFMFISYSMDAYFAKKRILDVFHFLWFISPHHHDNYNQDDNHDQ